jgi:hypothetical protein
LKEDEMSEHEEQEERPSETAPKPTQERIDERDDTGRLSGTQTHPSCCAGRIRG